MNKHKHPEIFHGAGYSQSYFEGWYYKQVTADRKQVVSFIPGINFDKTGKKAFIQCLHLNANNELSAYNVEYDVHSFYALDEPFCIGIEDNRFSLEHVKLTIQSRELQVSGALELIDRTPIQTSILTPNIMGFFSYIPYMECNHGIVSMSHQLEGSITINGENVDFTGGRGYIEKDWGKSFPKYYSWIQSNHFTEPSTALFCAVANIPFLGGAFKGHICNLIHQGKEYRFGTYNGTRVMQYEISGDNVSIVLRNRQYTLEIEGIQAHAKKLWAPKRGSMNKIVKEGLSGKVEILLTNREGATILHDSSHQCGMELVKALMD